MSILRYGSKTKRHPGRHFSFRDSPSGSKGHEARFSAISYAVSLSLYYSTAKDREKELVNKTRVAADKTTIGKKLPPNGKASFMMHRGNPNPNPFLYQTRAQRQRVAAEKEKQGQRSMWRCLCRHMTLWPCFDVVLQRGLRLASLAA